jgi:hypothetical protein
VKSLRLASGRSEGAPFAEEHLQFLLRRLRYFISRFVIVLRLNCIQDLFRILP